MTKRVARQVGMRHLVERYEEVLDETGTKTSGRREQDRKILNENGNVCELRNY